ncbi:MAG: S-layer homology domain-containing protein [Clostridia bacterium]|nr:S-layer homology domain-containing protein [Clostridia bacterium]
MRRIINILLMFAMTCTFADIPAYAETTITQDADGFYLIGTADEYVEFVELSNIDGTINCKLTADIDLAGKKPGRIGAVEEVPYSGTFDGNGHIIRNFTYNEPYENKSSVYVGLIGVAKDATIKNLGLENASVIVTQSAKGGAWLGGIAGKVSGTTTIEGCYVKNSIIEKDTEHWAQAVGAIAPMISSKASIRNCYVIGCTVGYAIGTIYPGGGGLQVGTIVGYTGDTATEESIQNCYAVNNVIRADGERRTNFARYRYQGTETVTFINCYTDILDKYSAYDTATVISDISELTPAKLGGETYWKSDTYGLNSGAPRLAWEKDFSASEIFRDISGNWAKDYIEQMYAEGIVKGNGDGTFAPEKAVTREALITMLVRALGIELVTDNGVFTDVSDDDWFAPYVITAFENNIVNGVSDDKFGVSKNISRQDMCVIVHNAMKDLLQDGTKEKRFSDDYKISDYAKTAVYSLKESGIVNGRGENEFEPLGTATRAEAARIIHSLRKLLSAE